MELSKNFEPQSIENKWYSHWMNKGYFKSVPDHREPYTIVMPPPNVTGVLHMGHCLNNTIQDILIRRARMQGKNACWVPGTDHASIATEAKVVGMLREKGIAKSSLTRTEFLKYAWEWKEKYGGIILEQLKKMGCSLDWDRTAFTMDDDYYQSVITIFIKLYNDGIIYRGLRMVNWDPVSLTALSDEEVIFKEVDSKLYYVSYPLVDGTGSITVATTRPETIMGDVAICVNPTDERYAAFVGKQVIVPIINRKIPVIADDYVDATFGTGALKITPAHDKNDNEIGRKHQLASLNTLDASGKFTAEALTADLPNETVQSYVGIDRFELRKKIAADIDALGRLQKVEDYKGQVGTSERTGAIIESRLSLQWFMNMKLFIEQNKATLDAILTDDIKLHPSKLKNTYSYWIENIKDWCISRQLWWGQQIPAWYDAEGNFVVAADKEAAAIAYSSQYNKPVPAEGLAQDEDCLDTWFSSWLWPIEVFKGISNPNNNEIDYYYPTTTLVTGQDILFFWVARMVMAGFAFKGTKPFKDVYFTGMVRDNQGRKMSKQLGNSPDLLGLIDQYGADAVRFGIMIASPAGNDILFDENALEQGRNFNNKMWNALKLLQMWKERQATTTNDANIEQNFAIQWFKNRLIEVSNEVNDLLNQFKLSEALKVIYSLIWDDYCSWYLEWVKPGFEQPIDKIVYEQSIAFFGELMQLLHPFMPFVTEEIYHVLATRTTDLMVTTYQTTQAANQTILNEGLLLKNIISGLRDIRNKNQIKPKDSIQLHIQTSDTATYKAIEHILAKQINAAGIYFVNDAVAGTITSVIGKDKFFIETSQPLNVAAQKEALEKELQHLQGFLLSVDKKLSNEKFVANAKPEVLALEQKKKADALAKMSIINESLQSL
ncbi:valine--tRNA ligase [Ferruginibacter yonginensis]|uniref:Valine--tRNA ligase n=1 Tax=Ferruginibacter yonginensis TaxID=1310416 RepID=A0ABV8QN37_9BACT